MTSLPLASTARLAPPQDPPLRLAPASRELANAPAWRRDPWKVFFPLGLVLAWVGVLPWLLFGLGLTETYLSIFHAMVQVQGFLFCFAMGFLFTFLPRRTGTAPPSAIELVLCLMSPVALAALALAERWALSQLFWFLPLGVLIRFALSRMLHSRKRGQFPPAFLWVGMGLLCGVAGGVLAGVGGALGDDFMWLHDAGRALVLQGVFTGLVLGTGSFLLPAITRGTDTASVAEGAAWRRSMILHLVGAALWISAAFVEPLYSVRLAFAIRGAVTAAVLIGTTRLWRPPSMPGLHRWLTWVSGWMLPLGSFIVAIDPGLRRGGLHVTLIGCFALLVLSVGAHVSLSHGGRPSLLSKRPWQLWIVAALVAAALAARLCIDAFPALALVWFAIAAGAFLASTIVWSTLALVPQRKPLS